jgi:hypothetical protein
VPALTDLLAAGYVVAATDYQGLGTPGVHQYLIGPTEARNGLDAARAARQIVDAGAGPRTVVLGWSQGGGTAVWAAQLTDYAGDDLEVVGSVGLAPADPAADLIALQQPQTGAQSAAATGGPPLAHTLLAVIGLTAAFADLSLSDVLTPLGIQVAEGGRLRQCVHHLNDAANYAQGTQGPVFLPTRLNQE